MSLRRGYWILGLLLAGACHGSNAAPADGGSSADSGPGIPDAGPTFCNISGFEADPGLLNPLNDCQSCQVAANPRNWTNLAPGVPCGDGGVCVDGACLQGCVIDGGYYPTGAVGCMECRPARNTSAWTEVADGTDCGGQGLFCWGGSCLSGCWIAAAFRDAGSVSPANECQVCDPIRDAMAWSDIAAGTPCGDGGICYPSGTCRPPYPGCSVGNVQVPNGASNPTDPSLCCNVSLNAYAWSARLVPAGTYTTGTDAWDLGAGDFDGDGLPDLAVANPNSNEVSVFLNQQGKFLPPTVYTVGMAPRAILAVDLNLDGFADLVTENATSQTLTVLMSKGDGTFAPPVHYPSGQASIGSLKSGDFNGDGIPDLVCAADLRLTFYIGVGDGGLIPQALIPGIQRGEVATGRFAGPLTDVAVAVFQQGLVLSLLATADGGFATAGVYSSGASARPDLLNIVAADLDGDGIVDLAVAQDIGGLAFLRGKGDGTFGPWIDYPIYGSGLLPTSLVGDGSVRLLVADGTSVDLWTPGDGGLLTTMLVPDAGANGPMALGDFNGDPAADLAILNGAGLEVFYNGCP